MSWAEAVERTMLTTEFLSCVFPQVNIQIGLKTNKQKKTNNYLGYMSDPVLQIL